MVPLSRLRSFWSATEGNPVRPKFLTLRQEHEPPFLFVDHDAVHNNTGFPEGEEQERERYDSSYKTSHWNGILFLASSATKSSLHQQTPGKEYMGRLAANIPS